VNTPTIAIDARLVDGTNTGDSTYWTGLVHSLAKIETNCRFLLMSNAARPKSIPDRENFRWIRLPCSSSRWWSLVLFPLAARKAGATSIHTQYTLSPLVGPNGITTIHDVSFLIEPRWFSTRDRTLLKFGVLAAARRARTILTVSHTSKKEIESFLPRVADKISVTYNACPSWIEPSDPEQSRKWVNEKFGFEEPYLLTVGTRWPRKNMELAIEAVNRLSERIPHKLLVTGKGDWGRDELGHRAIATGYLENDRMGTLYSGAAAYLAPSRHEGFGIPLLEAFRCGCPVMCSSGGAMPEVAGNAAAVVQGWEANVWAADLERLLDDPSRLKSMREAGFQREKEFTWAKMAQQTLKVYLDEHLDRR
jgi:glycosyltransferase involved in cell wall biosynthesis